MTQPVLLERGDTVELTITVAEKDVLPDMAVKVFYCNPGTDSVQAEFLIEEPWAKLSLIPGSSPKPICEHPKNATFLLDLPRTNGRADPSG